MALRKLRKNKEGIFRTLEAFIAIFASFLFLLIFIPQQREQAVPATPPNVLANLASNGEFRNCAIIKNYTCVNQTIDQQLADIYSFKTNISEKLDSAVTGLPDSRVYANSMFIAGNTTNNTRLIVRLYFWTKK